jgi:hypothetical protein
MVKFVVAIEIEIEGDRIAADRKRTKINLLMGCPESSDWYKALPEGLFATIRKAVRRREDKIRDRSAGSTRNQRDIHR